MRFFAKEISSRKWNVSIGTSTLLLLAVAMFVGQKELLNSVWILYLVFINIIFHLFFLVFFKINLSFQLSFQYFVVSLFGLMFSIIFYVSPVIYTTVVILIYFTSLLTAATMLMQLRNNLVGLSIEKEHIEKKLKEVAPYTIIIILFIIVTLKIYTSWIKGDSYYYYRAFQMAKAWDLSFDQTFEYLRLCNHTSFAYAIWGILGYLTFPVEGIGIRMINILLACITLCLIPSVVKYFFPDSLKWHRLLCTAVFAFSPMVIGGIAEINTDFPALCFFIWMLYFHQKNQHVLMFFSSMFFAFSKEPCIVYLFFYALFYCISELKGKTIYSRRTIYNIIAFLIVGLFWGLYYICSGGALWNDSNNSLQIATNAYQMNQFGINFYLIFNKLKELFIINYVWILIPGYLFLAFSLAKSGIKKYTFFPLIGFYIGFLFINLFFITYIPYRYICFQIIYIIIVLAYYLNKYKKNFVCIGLSLVFACLFISSSFITTDIFTLKSFTNINIGKAKIISTRIFAPQDGMLTTDETQVRKFLFSNSITHNHQYLSFETCFEEFLSDIGPDDQTAIILSDIYDEQTVYVILGRGDYSTYHWNSAQKDVVLDSYYPQLHIFNGVQDLESILNDFEKVFYVVFPFEEQEAQLTMLGDTAIMPSKVYSENMWEITVYQIK